MSFSNTFKDSIFKEKLFSFVSEREDGKKVDMFLKLWEREKGWCW